MTNIARLQKNTSTSTSTDDPRAAADPLRAALARAIKDGREAQHALDRQKAGFERVQAAAWAGAGAIEAAEKNIEKVQQSHAAALAKAAAAGTASPRSAVRAARQALADVQDEVDANKAALAQLRADLKDVESDACTAATEIESAISAILAPLAVKLIERGRGIASQLSPIREALHVLLGEPSPVGHEAALAHEQARRPLGEAKLAAAAFLKSTTVIQRTRQDPWIEARAILRTDAFAALLELDALVNRGRADAKE